MPRDFSDFLPSPPPFLPIPRFLAGEMSELEENNPLAPEELRALEGRYGTWAARLADAFAVDLPSAERIAQGLAGRIARAF